MDLFYRCERCSMEDVWRIRVHGTRPMARTMIDEVRCPVCGGSMVETGFDAVFNIQDLRGKFIAAR